MASPKGPMFSDPRRRGESDTPRQIARKLLGSVGVLGLSRRVWRAVHCYNAFERGQKYAAAWRRIELPLDPNEPKNELRTFFDDRVTGAGIWKWVHYLDIFDRHFAKFKNKNPVIMEIGVFSGGSLDMWRSYFGEGTTVVGVDIMPECKAYERDGVKIMIGDQADRDFWKKVRETVPVIDILIDDGGHLPEQQMITLEEMLPHISPGGIFVCEDVHGSRNYFSAFAAGLSDSLNQSDNVTGDENDPERRYIVPTSPFQEAVHSVCQYPFLTLVERRSGPLKELRAPRHGTEFQPFIK